MRTISDTLATAQADQAQAQILTVIAHPSAEALVWTKAADELGPTGYETSDELDYAACQVCVTTDGYLHRLMRVGTSLYHSAALNLADPDLAAWDGLFPAKLGTRPTIVADASFGARMFYINESGALCYKTIAGGFGGDGTIATTTTFGGAFADCAIAAANFDNVFVCHRRNMSSPYLDDPATSTLWITAYQYIDFAWVATDMPRQPTPRANTYLTQDDLWQACCSFAAGVVDPFEGIMCCMYTDDLSGRPVSVLYQNRHFGWPTPVEAIDVGQPERDTVLGAHAVTQDGKILLSTYRIAGDSDWVTQRSGALYYSTDGKTWSSPYFLGDDDAYNRGTAILWQGQFALVSAASIWTCPQTALFGLDPDALTLDISASVLKAELDEPDQTFEPKSLRLTLDNTFRQYLTHPYLQHGNEISIKAGMYDVTTPSEQVDLFRGAIYDVQPKPARSGGAIDLEVKDFLHDIKTGELDHVLVYPQPYKLGIPFDSKADIDRVASTVGSWDFYKTSTYGSIRAHQKLRNEFRFGSGIDSGDLTVIGRFMFQNPDITGGAMGVANTAIPELKLMWNLTATNPRTGYEVRCGNFYADGFHLYKYKEKPVLNADGQETGVYDYFEILIGSSGSLPVNQWFRLIVHQRGGLITVGYSPDDDTTVTELFSFFDMAPFPLTGVVAVECKLPFDPPTDTSVPFHTILVNDMQVYGHECEFSGEECIRGISVQRGFDSLTAEQIVNGGGGGTLIDSAENALGDVDVTFLPGEHLWFSSRVIDSNNQINLFLQATDSDGHASLECQITRGGVLDVQRIMLAHTPLWTGRRVRVRFITSGDWSGCYIGNALAGMFWHPEPNSLPPLPGAFAVTGSAAIHARRCPRFNVTAWPVLKPGDTLDGTLTDLLTGQQGWMEADNRNLRIGTTYGGGVVSTIDDSVWMGAGYQIKTEEPPTHVRVVSADEQGNELSGTVFSPDIWAKRGRMVVHIEKVDGLRSAQECRDTAWKMLLEKNRRTRTRQYPVHPRLDWQRFDILNVVNTLDDTDDFLLVAGLNRSWTRTKDQEFTSLAMTVTLHEYGTLSIRENKRTLPVLPA